MRELFGLKEITDAAAEEVCETVGNTEIRLELRATFDPADRRFGQVGQFSQLTDGETNFFAKPLDGCIVQPSCCE